MAEGKPHLSVVICGHVDSGKSTTTGRLIFELGGIPARELDKLKEEAAALGKSSFAFAFYMDRQKEERERGVTISCTTKEFFTEKWHYTIIDAPGALAFRWLLHGRWLQHTAYRHCYVNHKLVYLIWPCACDDIAIANCIAPDPSLPAVLQATGISSRT